jgi:hypothetical protein
MKRKIKAGTTNFSVYIFIQDATSTDGSGLTGLTGGMTPPIRYGYRRGSTSGYSVVTTGVLTSHTAWSIAELDATNFPGLYQFDISDNALANADSSVIMLHGATNMVPVLIEIELDQIDYQSDSYAKLEASAGTIVTGNPVAGTLSTTEMTTNLTETTDDHYNGRVLVFTSGTLYGQATNITDYDGASKKLTFTALTEAPQTGGQLTSFVIV